MIFSGGQQRAVSKQPTFSFLDQAPHTRGHAAFPSELTIGGKAAKGIGFFPEDVDNVALTWPERFGSGAVLTANVASTSITEGIAAYGTPGCPDKKIYFRYNRDDHYQGTNGLFDPGNDDFIISHFSYNTGWGGAGAFTGDTRVGDGEGGVIFYRNPSNGYLYDYIIDENGTQQILTSYGAPWASVQGYKQRTFGVDRDRADGGHRWFGPWHHSPTWDPTPLGYIGSAGQLTIGSRWTYLHPYYGNGTVDYWVLYHAPGWLDHSDGGAASNAAWQSVLAQYWGRKFTRHVGAADNCGDITANAQYIQPAWQQFNSPTPATTMRCNYSPPMSFNADGSESYVEVWKEGYIVYPIPGAEIPTTGAWTVEFWVRDSNSTSDFAVDRPLLSFSDGTSTENFEVGVTTGNRLYAKSDSASGDNGYVEDATTNLLEWSSFKKVSVSCAAGRLAIAINDVIVAVDTSSTVPTGCDRIFFGANYDKSVFADCHFAEGPGYGLKIYNYARF